MNNGPLVSVIIPTYNRADLVGRAVDSVLGQTYRDIEVVVVDDGSTDGTQQALAKYGDRIRVIRQGNAGPAAARNRGVGLCRGGILAFLDSDDIWLPGKLKRQVDLLEKAGEKIPCCLCNCTMHYTNAPLTTSFLKAVLVAREDEGLWLNVARVVVTRFVLFNQTAAIRRWALDRVGGFDESLRLLEDYDLLLRLSLLGPWAFIREPLVVWNGGSSHSLYERAMRDMQYLMQCEVRLREKVLAFVESSGDHAELRRPMRRALRKARRQQWVAGLAQSPYRGSQGAGRLISEAERYWAAAWRRSPWFPKMETVPIA